MRRSKESNGYWPIEDHSIVELFLDQKNIRLPISMNTQSALIQDLFFNEDAFELVVSFVQNDLFPDEFPIAVREKGKLIVIEGNRRLAALKALNEPSIVPSFKDKIRNLTSSSKIRDIKIVVAPNRDAAIKHIANKHTINYRRPWKPLRQAYFYKSQIENGKTIEQLKREYLEHDIPKFIRMIEMHHLAKSESFDAPIMEKIHDERKFPITNLERIYDNPYVQAALGFTFDSNGKFKGKIEKDEFLKGFRKLIEDIAIGEIDSRKTNTRSQIRKYIDELPEQYKPDLERKGRFLSKDFKEIKVEKSVSKLSRSNPKPTGLFLGSQVPYKLKNDSLRFLYEELREINVEKFPNATHDLLRSFLECALIVFFKQVGEYALIQKRGQHNPTLGEMLSHIINGRSAYITDVNVVEVVKQIKGNFDRPYSLERLNMINHNENWNSTERDVRGAWSKIEGLVKVILNPNA